MAALEGHDKAVHSLAKEIRESDESEQFDLAGYTQPQIEALVQTAFNDPIPVQKMIKFTFLIGAGKLARQKYDPQLPKFLGAALRNVGYEEDRTASAVEECQGTFKQQHDTDKNLKTLQVFPRVTISQSDAAGAEEGGDRKRLQDLGSPGYVASVCKFDTFTKMVQIKTQSWAQRRRLLGELKEMVEQLGAIEAKMMSGQPLSEEEQELYDAASVDDIGERVAWLEKELKGMVDGGEITIGEKLQLLGQVEHKIETITQELAAAHSDDKPKKAEKLETQLQKLKDRHAKLDTIVPIRHPLKHEDQIIELRIELEPLRRLEETKGRLLSMDEMRMLSAKPPLEEQIAGLEQESRRWLESDEEFSERCEVAAKAAVRDYDRKLEQAAKKKKSSSSSTAASWKTAGKGKRW